MGIARDLRLAEFRSQRFGLFIHWGLYSLAARHEWVKTRERIGDEQYDAYLEHFSPDLYDPEQWAETALEAGMRYVVVTAKHHEGFALWPSKAGDYTVAQTPWQRDVLGPLVEACRRRGLGVGFYYSLIDWRHPHFAVDGLHPQRDEPERRGAAVGDMEIYRQFIRDQVSELLTEFGPIDTIWFDFSYPDLVHEGADVWGGKGKDDWGSEELVQLVRRLQPQILINDRLDLPQSADFVTPEQYQPQEPMRRDGNLVPWEACQTLNGSWGYDRDNLDWKPVDMLVRMLIDSVSNDGNLLLNVGPNGRGEFGDRARETLHGIGRWMRVHERSIVNAGPSEFSPPKDARYTQRGNRLYLHLFAWPMSHVHLAGLDNRVEYAQFLHDASEVRQQRIDPEQSAQNTTLGGLAPGTLTLELPIQRPDVAVPVIELFLKDG